MTYKLRNTVILLGIWLVVLIGGLAYWAWWQPRQQKKINADIQKVNKELEDLPGLQDEVQRLALQYQDVKRRYDSRSKEIPQFDISSQTYGYMSRGIDEAGFLKFDMKFIGTKEEGNWGYNAYKLEQGEAPYENFFKFIYFLENGRRLYKVASMRMEERETIDPDSKDISRYISFDMELHAYFVKNIQELGTSLAAKPLAMIPTAFDPFKSIITQVLATEPPPGEINADRLEVKAVLPGKAFVLTDNELIVLHVGDKVWRGNVTRISPVESAVEFTLDEGGILRKLLKRIMFDKRSKTR